MRQLSCTMARRRQQRHMMCMRHAVPPPGLTAGKSFFRSTLPLSTSTSRTEDWPLSPVVSQNTSLRGGEPSGVAPIGRQVGHANSRGGARL